MPTFITLMNFTEQGVRNIKDTTKRAEAFKEQAREAGLYMTHVYWTMGSYDVVAICEARDEATATAALISLVAAGNVRTQTLRAFSSQGMNRVLGSNG